MKKGCEKLDLMPIVCTTHQRWWRTEDGTRAYLMMDVMIVCVVPANHLERIEGQAVSTVVVDGLACAERKDEHGLPYSEKCEALCNNGT